jgi:hypothetical protein
VAVGAVLSTAALLLLSPHHGTGGGHEQADGGKAAAADPNPAVNQPDQFAWELFVSINAPADNGTNDVIWETWANQNDVYADPNKKPVWPGKAQQPKKLEPIFQRRLRNVFLQSGARESGIVAAHAPLPQIQQGGGEEVRMNKATFDYIVDNNLWYREGQEAVFTSGGSLTFPIPAKEIKAVWKPIDEKDKPRFHWNVDADKKLYGLIALHISSKDLPNWFWATWEQIDNPARCKVLGCHDSFGLKDGKVSPALLDLFKQAKMGKEWEYYRLDGAQIDFTDSTGRPTLLGNSITESGFVQTSSCLTCHARSTINAAGEILPVFAPDGQSYNGTPDPNWYYSTATNPPTRKFLQRDFVYSLLLAKPRSQ